MVLSCDVARKLLADAIRDRCDIPDLAQAILSLTPEGADYADFIDDALGRNNDKCWPQRVNEACDLIESATGINPDKDRKENYSDAIRRSRQSKRIQARDPTHKG